MKPLFIVADAFELKGRGIVVIPENACWLHMALWLAYGILSDGLADDREASIGTNAASLAVDAGLG